MGTYAFGLPAVERLDILPLRQFLRQLVVAFRRDPESLWAWNPTTSTKSPWMRREAKGNTRR